MPTPHQTYEERIRQQTAVLRQLLRRRRQLGWLRLFVFLLAALAAWQTFRAAGHWGWLPVAAGIALLLFLVSKDTDNNGQIAHTRRLVRLNQEELELLAHRFQQRFDGAAFLPADHPYANDLDLFGKASLFQWLNRCQSEQGRRRLAAGLLQALPAEAIRLRQEAVRELAPLTNWRQQLQARTAAASLSEATEARVQRWLYSKDTSFASAAWALAIPAYTLLTLGSLAALVAGWMPLSLFSGLYALYFITASLLSRNTIRPYLALSGVVPEVTVLQQTAAWIEGQPFAAPWLKTQQAQLQQHQAASLSIRRLKHILDRFDLRISLPGFLFFNPFLLWDLRQMRALSRWKTSHLHAVAGWFGTLAEMEVLQSLAAARFNCPDWCMPEVSGTFFRLEAEGLGHPLLPAGQRVTNDFSLAGTPAVALVTGSNMAGKSTFLRSLGINTVLAQVGGPVCAARFTLPPLELISSMRVADNLAESTSTFYAELKKLKAVIDAVNEQRPVFILLDEILRGTNSLDRHTGSAALIRQLVRRQAVAVIATHDVELARLSEESPAVHNYHFDVQVAGEELYFDYLLKPGVCTSLNASILMKKVGIELEDG